jgi:hypothetical protein
MIVDFCAYLGDWPAYELPYRTADGLLALMDRCGIGAACVSLAGGMFRFDAREANHRLAQSVEGHRDRLWPVGTLDPTVPTWREDLRDGLESLDLAGIRLHPTYHEYALDLPEVQEVAHRLAAAGRPLFVALHVDEERFQHPAMRIPNVPLDAMERFIRQMPPATLVLNNLKVEHAMPLLAASLPLDHVYLDINAMDMPFDGLRSLVQAHGPGRLVFGSQMPFLYPEAALMVAEHSGLPAGDVDAILERNWQADPVLARLAPGQQIVGHGRESSDDKQN